MSWWQWLLSYGVSICVFDFFLIKFYEPTRLYNKGVSGPPAELLAFFWPVTVPVTAVLLVGYGIRALAEKRWRQLPEVRKADAAIRRFERGQ